jgi:carboxyl-terminal processing protease
MKPTTAVLVVVPLLAVLAATGVVFFQARGAEARADDGLFWDDEVASYVRRMVAASYVDDVSGARSTELFYSALDGYLKPLDEYCDFIPPDDYRKWKEEASGEYEGIGVKVNEVAEGLELAGVLPGGPAARAGLKVGDVLTAVEGRTLRGVDLRRDGVVRTLKGPPGSRVRVSVLVKAAPGPARDVVVERGTIRTPSVFARRVGANGKTGYLRISQFAESTAEDFDAELDRMLAGGVTSVVLDLRGNGGGVLPAVVHVADRFLSSGEILRMTGRAPNATRVERAKSEGTIPESIGLVVLVDGRSASASEVLAGAIQDHRRGVLLGTRTYGKFLVQNITELSGKDAAIKLTTARYQTPHGRWYKRTSRDANVAEGLLPDIAVETSAADREKLWKAWVNAEDAVWGHPPEHPEVPADWVDPQLQRALDLLDGNVLLQQIREPKDRRNG